MFYYSIREQERKLSFELLPHSPICLPLNTIIDNYKQEVIVTNFKMVALVPPAGGTLWMTFLQALIDLTNPEYC